MINAFDNPCINLSGNTIMDANDYGFSSGSSSSSPPTPNSPGSQVAFITFKNALMNTTFLFTYLENTEPDGLEKLAS